MSARLKTPPASAREWLLRMSASLLSLLLVVGGIWALVVLALGRRPTDEETGLLLLSAAAAAIAALLYTPVREALSRRAESLLYGQRVPPDEPLRVLRDPRSRAVPLEELLLQVLEALRRASRLAAAELWISSGGSLVRTLSDPDRPAASVALTPEQEAVIVRAGVSGADWAATWLPGLRSDPAGLQLRLAPLGHSGLLLGLLVAERRSGDPSLTEEDDDLLAELAREVALVLHNARLDFALQASLDEVRRQADELRASRARIVAAGDAERRRIERDLHDGAQQRLIGLAARLGEARRLLPADPQRALETLDELHSELEATVDEVRELAQGIYPPLLADEGLAQALSAAAARAPLPCTVRCDGVGRYPQEVETAIYFCCLEAIQNAAKHGGEGARAAILVRDEDGRLSFEVADDGGGFDAATRGKGAGLTNMSDRIGAIGGRFDVNSTPGHGTRVAGILPLRRPDRQAPARER